MNKKEKIALLSVMLNSCMIGVKFGFGKWIGSYGLIADAIHSIVDLISASLMYLGVRFSSYKSQRFPYGLYKLENLFSLTASIIVFIAGYEILRRVTKKENLDYQNIIYGIIAVIVIIAITYLFSKYEFRIAKKENSPALEADATDWRVDSYSSIVVLLGLIGSYLHIGLDRFVAVIIVLIIFNSGWKLLKKSVMVLLDASLDFTTLEQIKAIVLDHIDVKEIKELKGRNSGSYKFVELNIVVDLAHLEEAHELITHIEEDIKKKFPEIEDVLVHYEPYIKEEVVVAVPLEADRESLSPHIGDAKFWVFLNFNRSTKEHSYEIKENPFKELKQHKGVKTAEWLIENNVDYVILKEIKRTTGAIYALKAYEVKVIEHNREKFTEILNDIINDKIKL